MQKNMKSIYLGKAYQNFIKCEWSKDGYCEVYGSAKEQEHSETQWPCSGTEENMQECGQVHKKEN